jgi:hypothetical protein
VKWEKRATKHKNFTFPPLPQSSLALVFSLSTTWFVYIFFVVRGKNKQRQRTKIYIFVSSEIDEKFMVCDVKIFRVHISLVLFHVKAQHRGERERASERR